MKSFILLIVVLLLVSCGNQKIRFSPVKHKTQTIVKVDEKTRASVKSQRNTKPEQEEVIAENVLVESTSTAIDDVEEKTKTIPSKETEIDKLVDEKQPSSDDEKVTQALEAEKNAKRAAGFLIGGFVGFFALIVPGIVLFIFGAIYYHRAKNAQYISEKGQDSLQFARVFYFIDFVLAAALVIGITGMIISNAL